MTTTTMTATTFNTPIANDPFFNVNRIPAFAEFNGEKVELNKHALVDEKGSVLGVVSPTYKLVTNNEVNDIFMQAFSDYKVGQVTDHLNNNGSQWVREIVFDDDEFTKEITTDDVVKLKVKLFNGYNGKNAVGYALSGYRLVCKNGMMGWDHMFSKKLPHVSEGIVDTIKNSFATNVSAYSKVFDKVKDWTKEPFSLKDFEKFILDKVKKESKENGKVVKTGYLTEKAAQSVIDRYPVLMNQYNESNTKWGAYNVLTAIATHETATKSSNSYLFTHGYKRMERLAEDFVKVA